MKKTIAPYGAWRSPITTSTLTAGGLGLTQVRAWGNEVYWIEDRPLEEGRSVVVQRAQGRPRDVTPAGYSVRTRAHEYGGGAYTIHHGTVFFSNDEDQRLYRQDVGASPVALTPLPELDRGLRYADPRVSPCGAYLVCVRETHLPNREPIHEVVALPADGSSPPQTIVAGSDFYSSPCFSPDGDRLAWLTWEHPRMPWDGTELWAASFSAPRNLTNLRRIAGGPEESIFQPAWGPDGTLHFVSDRSGWWNLYRDLAGESQPVSPSDAEFGCPQWTFGQSRYTFLSAGRLAAVYSRDGIEHLGLLQPGSSEIERIELPYTSFGRGGELTSDGDDTLFFVGASPDQAPAVVAFEVGGSGVEVLRPSLEIAIAPAWISHPRPVEFPTAGGRTAHALFYPPANPDYEAPAEERPPLIVMGHGGPTSQATSDLRLVTQFWTSRGFAVVDVNYGGSTGYGREYRERLNGQWGVVDTEDCVNAARYLEDRGKVDGRRMVIRGSSAGGYLVLCAMVFHDVFAAGTSYYGVADVEELARNTHKFESRYLDSLIGPYPEDRALYQERSPIRFAERINSPVLLLQGTEDKVVPPSQAEVFAEALRKQRLPFSYLLFEGEAHGFRRAATIHRAIEAELSFYAQLFGFKPADTINKVLIENL